MTTTVEAANREISRLRDLPYGLARTAAFEQLVARLEAEGPEAARAYGYAGLVESLVWGQEVQKAFVPFTRWLRWADEHPEHLDDGDWHLLHWSFKWMVSDLMEYPSVSREQIERTLADMERRYALAGNGMNAVRHERFLWEWSRGTPDAAAAYESWVTTPRDDFSQCEACEPGDRASYLFDAGRTDEGIRLLEATLPQDPRCATEPADMLSLLQLAYLDAGRYDDAARTYRRALASLDQAEGGMVGARGRHVVFLLRAGHRERALARLVAEGALLVAAPTPWLRLVFLRQAAGVTAWWRTHEPERPVAIEGVPAGTVAELDDWVLAQARALTSQFDERDGTDGSARALAEALVLDVVTEPVDLTVLALGGRRESVAPAADGHGSGHEPAGTRDAGPAADGTSTSLDDRLRALSASAEDAFRRGDLAVAGEEYQRLAVAAQDGGLLTAAGMAYAEAARCAQELHDEVSAGWAYEQAVALLRAGGAEPLVVAAVVRAWAPVAAEHGRAEALLDELARLDAALGAEPEAAAGGDAPDEAATALRAERARLTDIRARTLATLGRAEEAAGLAVQGAEAFAGVGMIASASDAFWLAGRLHRDLAQEDRALWCLESAVEGFELARDRQRRAGAAGDLITLLRARGQDGRADELARSLA
ncbi:hypothetical protein KIN34_16070 [Cellulomonas sp. DKR-3]|uniref:Tetratricopeptide repeat protein n=1 Tax=Cellulomonas fulva TaxID=2835530 RepID=A0ABS5U346_9CELL|nr:hypothetical protein [Cellulomonas fulva]MBT0995796.1 hypothetical protein [Cellulomonas fulva]